MTKAAFEATRLIVTPTPVSTPVRTVPQLTASRLMASLTSSED